MSARASEQQQFENALRKNATAMGMLRRAVARWAGNFSNDVVEATIFHCGLYYCACLPAAQSRRSRSKLKRDIRKATNLTARLAPLLQAIWGSRDTTVQRWLDPVLGAYFRQRDGLHGSSLDPSFVHGLDELWRRLALLGQALPDDPGGNRVALAFNELTSWLAGIYCTVTMTEAAPTSMREPFFPYVAAVVDLLKGARRLFPKAEFDLPPSDEALRKAIGRTRRTQPTP
jgi:hypothetical protein